MSTSINDSVNNRLLPGRDRSSLISSIRALTPFERRLKEHPTDEPSAFYRRLEEQGMRRSDGVYRMPSIFVEAVNTKSPETLSGYIDQSPCQQYFRLKKATRFSREPLAYADFLCIRYVYSGSDRMRTPSFSFELQQNDICLLNAGFVMSQYLEHEEDAVFTLMFEKEYLIKLLRRRGDQSVITRFIYSYVLDSPHPQNYILFHGGRNDRLPRLFEDLIMEYAYPDHDSHALLESYLQVLLVEMARCDFDYEKNAESRKSFLTAAVLQEIEDKYEEVTLEGLADRFGYHPDYISRRIRAVTGKGFKDYLLQIKMSHVERFLKGSDLTISEIRERVGFHNETHFYRKFKEMFGCSPNEMRLRAHGEMPDQ